MRWHRPRLSWGGKHPDHHPDNRHIPHGNPAPGHRIVGRPTVAMLWQVGHLLCMEVQQLVGWNLRRVRQQRGLTIEALAQPAHVSAAWLGEEFKNDQAPAGGPLDIQNRRMYLEGVPIESAVRY